MRVPNLMITLGVAGLLLLAQACTQTNERASSTSGGTGDLEKPMLIEAIRRRIAGSDLAVPFDSSLLRFWIVGSRVVPDLRYTWAIYENPRVSHGFAFAVAASRDGTGTLLESPADLWAVLRGWTPSDTNEAAQACEEVISVAGAGRDPRQPPLTYSTDSALKQTLVMDRPAIDSAGATAPLALREANGTWRVIVWSVERSTTRKYECTFRARGRAKGEFGLTVLDSVPLSGMLPP
jgi:hypothetical protein